MDVAIFNFGWYSCQPGFTGSYCESSTSDKANVIATAAPLTAEQTLLISFSTLLPVAGIIVIIIAAYYVWVNTRATPDADADDNNAQESSANRLVSFISVIYNLAQKEWL